MIIEMVDQLKETNSDVSQSVKGPALFSFLVGQGTSVSKN